MSASLRRLAWCVAAGAALVVSGGCAATSVKPWDRDLLAQDKMKFVPRPMTHAVDQHVYFSKEGSTGGSDAAGGGCRCN